MGASKFFLFCSGVSKTVLEKCPDTEIVKHVSIGASVFFTGILAMISSFFAFSLIFDGIFVIAILAFFWGLIIFNLDRYIVATLRKKGDFWKEVIQISPRIFLSTLIALVVAKPLELQIFKSEIEQNLNEQMLQKIAVAEQDYFSSLDKVDQEKAKLDLQLREFFELKEFYYQEYKCECDGTCGTGQYGSGEECFRKKEKYEDFIQEYQAKELEIREAKMVLEKSKVEKYSLFVEDKDNIKANFSLGLMARLQALNSLESWAPWTITLLILFVEIAPVLTKLFSSRGPYDDFLALEENNYKMEYINNMYQTGQHVENEYSTKLREVQLIKKELISDKQKKVQELYRDLGRELTKQINK
ncbi:MAG: hypothetical protein RL407_1955 [Bacteroidota bacterium]|jgi:Domain of unknown function (DUF4407)